MNFKSIITNPVVIGGGLLGGGILAGAIIWAKNRPKTEDEIALAKVKEANEESERIRQHELELAQIRSKQALDEFEAEEQTKRDAKREEERTKQRQIDLEKAKAQIEEAKALRDWEKNEAPADYWRLKAVEKESATQIEIAKLQAESAKHAADAQARSTRDRYDYDYRIRSAASAAESAKWQAAGDIIQTAISGRISP